MQQHVGEPGLDRDDVGGNEGFAQAPQHSSDAGVLLCGAKACAHLVHGGDDPAPRRLRQDLVASLIDGARKTFDIRLVILVALDHHRYHRDIERQVVGRLRHHYHRYSQYTR